MQCFWFHAADVVIFEMLNEMLNIMVFKFHHLLSQTFSWFDKDNF